MIKGRLQANISSLDHEAGKLTITFPPTGTVPQIRMLEPDS